MSGNAALEYEGMPFNSIGFNHLSKPEAKIIFSFPGYRVHYFSGYDYRNNLDELRESAIRIDMATFNITYEQAKQEVFFNMKKCGVRSASFVELDESFADSVLPIRRDTGREKDLNGIFDRLTTSLSRVLYLQDVYLTQEPVLDRKHPFVGYSAQEKWRVNTGLASRDVGYIDTIALIPELTGRGIGPILFQIPCHLGRSDIIALRSQTGAVVSALEKADLTEGSAFGVDVEWDTDPEMMALREPFKERTLHPNGIDEEKLIARAVYPEGRNQAYISGYSQGRAQEATDKLSNRGVIAENGDGAYIAKWVKGKGRLPTRRIYFFAGPK